MPALSSALLRQLAEEREFYENFIKIKSLNDEPRFPYKNWYLCSECPIHDKKKGYECCKEQDKFWDANQLYLIKRYAQKMIDKLNLLLGRSDHSNS